MPLKYYTSSGKLYYIERRNRRYQDTIIESYTMTIQINPYSDMFVRFLLGDERNKDLLLSFINAVNEDSHLPHIIEVTIKNPFSLKDYWLDKETILDIKALSENNEWYNIEVQVCGNELFTLRSLYYWSQMYSSQLLETEKYHKKTNMLIATDF
jgi:predicted transposase/invertase (TIGR01784 family)